METKRRRIGSGQAEQLQQQGAQQQDYYALLELPPTADFDAIKHAYHKLALKYHPDRNKGNEVECETKFKELAAAYAVLSDPEKRSQYDASHQARFWGQSNDMREVFNQFVSSGSTSSFSDFFGSFSSRSFSSRSFSSFASTGSTSSFASSTSSTSTSSSTSTFSASTSTSTTSSSSSSSFSSAATGLSGLFGHQGSFSFNKKRPPSKGQNLRTTLHVTFNESVVGCTKTIALKTLVWCSACGGLGVSGHVLSTAAASRAGGLNLHQQRTSSSALECSACGGTGTYSQRSSVVTINSTCSACDGKGIVVDETTKCKCCHHGRVHRTKELRIEVPAGVVKDMRKIYEGEGDVGEYGGVAGDLIVVFDVEDSPLFTREGDDATCDVAVSFFQAALGARLAVPGLHPGQLLCLDVPPGTQPHDVLRIENEGFVNVATRQRGHLYVRVVLDIPRSLTPHQADLLARAQLLWQQAEAEAQEAPAAAAVTESSVASEASSDESAATASMMTDYASSSYDETTTTTAPTMMMMATTTAADDDVMAAAVEPPEAAAAAAYGGDEVSETAAAPGSVPYEQQQQHEEEPQQHYDAVEPTTTMPRPTMPTLPSMFVNAGGLHHHHHHQIPLFDMHMNMHMAAAASAATSGPDSTVVGGYECS